MGVGPIHDSQISSALERLTVAVEGLSRLVGVLASQSGLGEWLRTGAACRLAGVTRQTLYRWDKQGLLTRGTDAIGEVVWDRDELLRLKAGRSNASGGRRARPDRNG